MYSSGIEHRRSSKNAAPSASGKSESTMTFTWRATEWPSSFLSMTPALTRASPNRRRWIPSSIRAEARVNSSSVIRPSAIRASPRRSFLRLLAPKTIRPWSKNTVFTVLPDRTWRSPLARPSERRRRVSEMGVTVRSVSIAPDDTTPLGLVDEERPPGPGSGAGGPGRGAGRRVQDHEADPESAGQAPAGRLARSRAAQRLAGGQPVLAVVHQPVDARERPLPQRRPAVDPLRPRRAEVPEDAGPPRGVADRHRDPSVPDHLGPEAGGPPLAEGLRVAVAADRGQAERGHRGPEIAARDRGPAVEVEAKRLGAAVRDQEVEEDPGLRRGQDTAQPLGVGHDLVPDGAVQRDAEGARGGVAPGRGDARGQEQRAGQGAGRARRARGRPMPHRQQE